MENKNIIDAFLHAANRAKAYSGFGVFITIELTLKGFEIRGSKNNKGTQLHCLRLLPYDMFFAGVTPILSFEVEYVFREIVKEVQDEV